MSTFKPLDSKREEFRRYLDSSGVLDALTKGLVLLYETPVKPDDALEFILKTMDEQRPSMTEIEILKTEKEYFENKVAELEKEIQSLKVVLTQTRQQLAAETRKRSSKMNENE